MFPRIRLVPLCCTLFLLLCSRAHGDPAQLVLVEEGNAIAQLVAGGDPEDPAAAA